MTQTNRITNGQLWMSTAEPSLGIGRVKKYHEGSINILFPQTEILRKYNIYNAPIERIVFQPGDRILLKDGKAFTVFDSEDRGGLIYYENGSRSVCETEISDKNFFETSVTRLVSGNYDTGEEFDLRYLACQVRNYIDKAPCKNLIGTRMELMPHQVYIAGKLDMRYSPRAILADEVGLGKTVEACMIMKKAITARKYHNILVITPEHLIIQWFRELFHRFGLTFGFIDDTYHAKKKKSGYSPIEKNDRIILSYNLIENDESIRKQVVEKKWDMIIIDEAHHVKENTALYGILKKISGKDKGLLLLSAIPDYPGLEHYFARLNLVDPYSFFKFDRFFWELEQYHLIAEIYDALASGSELNGQQNSLLADLLKCSKEFGRLAENDVIKDDESSRKEMMEFLLLRHGISRYLFRNSRKNAGDFPGRQTVFTELDCSDPKTAESLKKEFENDIGVCEEPEHDFKNDPRLNHLVDFSNNNPDEKILVLCRTLKKTLRIGTALRGNGFEGYEIFHEDMDILERDRKAAAFMNEKKIRILVSSEIGSEGRNFQFCTHLFFFDIPDRLDLIEQRIGRLDRIGQKNVICIHIPFVSGSYQDLYIDWLHRGLDAFNSTLQGCEPVYSRHGDFARKIILSEGEYHEKKKLLEDIILNTADEKNTVMDDLEKGRDRLIEINSFDEHEASNIVKTVNDYDDDPYIEYFMNDFFELCGIKQKLVGERTYRLDAETSQIEIFPEMNAKEYVITYDRKLAVRREDMEFFTMDHPFIERALHYLAGSQKGNASVLHWISDNENVLVFEMIFMIETLSPERLNASSFFPHNHIRIVFDENMNDMTEVLNEEILIENTEEMPGILFEKIQPRITRTIKPVIKKAKICAYEQSRAFLENAKNHIDGIYGNEIKRLTQLKSLNNSINDDDITFIMNQKNEIEYYIENHVLRLDGIRVIYRN